MVEDKKHNYSTWERIEIALSAEHSKFGKILTVVMIVSILCMLIGGFWSISLSEMSPDWQSTLAVILFIAGSIAFILTIAALIILFLVSLMYTKKKVK